MSQHRIESIHLPLLPMREEVIFPFSQAPFFIGRKPSMDALEQAMADNSQVFVVTQYNPATEDPINEDVFDVGTIGNILQVMRLPNGTVKALFEGTQRGYITKNYLDEGSYSAEIQPIEEELPTDPEFVMRAQSMIRLFQDYLETHRRPIKRGFLKNLQEANPLYYPDYIAPHLGLSIAQKHQILSSLDPEERQQLILAVLDDELEIRSLEEKLKARAREQAKAFQKEGYLQDQLKSIQKELGHEEDSRADIDALAKEVEETPMSEEAKEVAKKELKKLKLMSPISSEATVVRNYLEWLLEMPWQEKTEDNFNLQHATQILDDDHYGLEKVKERILEYLAVAQLKGTLKGPIICLVGPPGVGKTSLAKSVARALGRNYVHMSLGGVRDEAEIRGHRRTYIGALPGKVIQSIRKSKSKNPVLLMDEIDKLVQSSTGDPSAALLEVLDPEQNSTFMDHYLEVEYNLSDVLFLCTANTTQGISSPLLDRMEVISISGYTEIEKQAIAEQFLVPKQLKQHGLGNEQLVFRQAAIAEIIQFYTREAGVRNLDREISKVCRKTVTNLVRKQATTPITVTPKSVHKLLGVPLFPPEDKTDKNEIGVAMGLGVTSMGGELLVVEVGTMPGTGKLSLTGKLGDVMQESAQAAYSYVRSNAKLLGIDPEQFSKLDLHIHLPEGATPKDGPSAGLPLVTSIVSAFTKNPVRHTVAMTGEITLRGHVQEIGGLKEKLLAAKRGDLKEVLIPVDNEKDLPEIPEEVKSSLTIHPVKEVNEALLFGLEKPISLQAEPVGVS